MQNQETNSALSLSNLTETIKTLSTSLQSIQPNNSETTRVITYTLMATAIVGIIVYHYIKNNEDAP